MKEVTIKKKYSCVAQQLANFIPDVSTVEF